MQELSNIGTSNQSDLLIETTASNIIESSINLLNTINKNYDVETASELERRFLNSIRTGDPRKFKRAITKIIESKNDS